jgi:hypothetical protein
MSNPFLDVGFRVMAFAMGVYTCRQLWFGYVERKIRSVHSNTGILDWLLDWSTRPVFHRDTAPVQYWMQMGLQAFAMVACFISAIVGWWQPNS